MGKRTCWAHLELARLSRTSAYRQLPLSILTGVVSSAITPPQFIRQLSSTRKGRFHIFSTWRSGILKASRGEA
ncbi:hypothetical protein K504DRAFT_299603 [Pleomassaria siparia CBS 279.74]|uniref:Uncharacterized protein n=1 Tax=Pleomassaria siparia CBS 279.74 TaxID=1314801 RepID=A0A6G1K6Q7_9PLEO|nr:hypothetical protein K504DRAFT_299603 [Pleomassaria siparia CBS 279.74]